MKSELTISGWAGSGRWTRKISATQQDQAEGCSGLGTGTKKYPHSHTVTQSHSHTGHSQSDRHDRSNVRKVHFRYNHPLLKRLSPWVSTSKIPLTQSRKRHDDWHGGLGFIWPPKIKVGWLQVSVFSLDKFWWSYSFISFCREPHSTTTWPRNG